MDYYSLLNLNKDADQRHIKAQYHAALLRLHPDKRKNESPVDIALIKHAYTVLSTPELRAKYDAELAHRPNPRPAQIVSLEDFDDTSGTDDGPWTYPCRCSGTFTITADLMEDGVHLVACHSCSEAIWVGFELAE